MDVSNLPSVSSSRPYSPIALSSFCLGILSFIPYAGLFLGGTALFLGWNARKSFNEGEHVGRNTATLGILFGILGIALSVTLLFNFLLPRSDFGGRKKESARADLIQTASALELYRAVYGYYPESLRVLEASNFSLSLTDPYLYEYAYGISENRDTFSLLSLGADGTYNTEDDIPFTYEMVRSNFR